MYCPVCGDEFRKGFTRCPEHDVPLVEEPPEIVAEKRPFFLRDWNMRRAMRIVFLVFLVAASLHMTLGLIQTVWATLSTGRRPATLFFSLIEIQVWAYGLALGTFGVLAAAVLIETYLLLSVPVDDVEDDENGATAVDDALLGTIAVDDAALGAGRPPILGRWWPTTMKVLLALFVISALVWIVTGLATSTTRAELQLGVRGDPFTPQESLSTAQVTLFAVNHAAYAMGLGTLAILGAALILEGYMRLTAPIAGTRVADEPTGDEPLEG